MWRVQRRGPEAARLRLAGEMNRGRICGCGYNPGCGRIPDRSTEVIKRREPRQGIGNDGLIQNSERAFDSGNRD